LQEQINAYRALRKELRLRRKIYLDKQAEVEAKDGVFDKIKRRFSDDLKGKFSEAKGNAGAAYQSYTKGLEEVYDKHAALLANFKKSGSIRVEKMFQEMTTQERADSEGINDREYKKRIVKTLDPTRTESSPEMQKVKERKIVAWCDTLFTKRMAQDLDSIERMRVEKKSKAEGPYTKHLKAMTGWYRKQPLAMKILVGSAVGASAGAAFAGGAFLTGFGLFFARRVAGGTVGALVGMGTYAVANKGINFVAGIKEKKVVKQWESGLKNLTGSDQEGKSLVGSFQKNMEKMRGVRKSTQTEKRWAMGASAGVAMLAGRGTSAAVGDFMDGLQHSTVPMESGTASPSASAGKGTSTLDTRPKTSSIAPAPRTGPEPVPAGEGVGPGGKNGYNSAFAAKPIHVEGTYQKGGSVEKVFQEKVFSNLPEDQKGRAAHLLAEEYKTDQQALRRLGVQHGDIDKVPRGGGYNIEVSQQDLDKVIQAVTEAPTRQTVAILEGGKLQPEGTFEPGSSVQRELQTAIGKLYPGLTKEQVGAIAHRAQLGLASDPNAAKGFGIVRGDWNKVPEGRSYDVTVDTHLLDKEVARVRGISVEEVTKQKIAAATPVQSAPSPAPVPVETVATIPEPASTTQPTSIPKAQVTATGESPASTGKGISSPDLFSIAEQSHIQGAAKGFEGLMTKWFPYRGPDVDPALQGVLEKGDVPKDWPISGGETLRKYWPVIKEVRLTDLGVKGDVQTIELHGERIPVSPEMVGFLRKAVEAMSDGDPTPKGMVGEVPLAGRHLTVGDVVREKYARYLEMERVQKGQGLAKAILAQGVLEAPPPSGSVPEVPHEQFGPPKPDTSLAQPGEREVGQPEVASTVNQEQAKIKTIVSQLRKGDFHYRDFNDNLGEAELSRFPKGDVYRSVMTHEKLNATLGMLKQIPPISTEIIKLNWELLNPVPVSEIIDTKKGISFMQETVGDGPAPRTVELSENVENLMRDVLNEFTQDERIGRIVDEAYAHDPNITFGDLLRKIHEYQEQQRANITTSRPIAV